MLDSVWVVDGGILTIVPGTTVKFTPGIDPNGAWLKVERGGTINAAGTEAAPITFTSAAEDPQAGDWLAPVFLGKGPGQVPDWEVDPDHNLGVLQYIRTEYAQTAFGLINVGSGTTVDHISTYSGGGLLLYGGNVNVDHIAVHQSLWTGIHTTGGYTGTVTDLFVNGTRLRGVDVSNVPNIHAAIMNWIPWQWDQDLEPRTDPTLNRVTLCNILPSAIWIYWGGACNISNVLLYNCTYRWGPAISCWDDYLLYEIDINNLQIWNCRGDLYDNNALIAIDMDTFYEQDPLLDGFVPTDPLGIGTMVDGDWLSAWGHTIDIESIAFAGFDYSCCAYWHVYEGIWRQLLVPGDVLTMRTWYFMNTNQEVQSADIKVLFESEVYDVLSVYPDTEYIPPGEASVEYNVVGDTIVVSFTSNTTYWENVYLFNIDLQIPENYPDVTTHFSTADPAVIGDPQVHFINDEMSFYIPANHFGDVSIDREISSLDAELILMHLVGNGWISPVQEYFGNVSGDEELSAYDASLIQQYVAGLIDGFPVETGEPPVQASGFLSMENGEVLPGETIEVPLYLSEGDSILSFEAGLNFNPDHLSLEEIQWSLLLQDFIIEHSAGEGLITIAGAGALPDGESGVFATSIFSVNQDMTTSSTEVVLSDLRWNEGEWQYDVATAILINVVATDPAGQVPQAFELKQNHPNPFNPITTIGYDLPEVSGVILTVYDISGRTITTLTDIHQPAGFYDIEWDATDDSGHPVSTGVYFCRLQAGEFHKTIKMVYLR